MLLESEGPYIGKSWFLVMLLKGLPAESKEVVKEHYGSKDDVLILDDCRNAGGSLCNSNDRPYQLINTLKVSRFLKLFPIIANGRDRPFVE